MGSVRRRIDYITRRVERDAHGLAPVNATPFGSAWQVSQELVALCRSRGFVTAA
jgi:hypothetical protein